MQKNIHIFIDNLLCLKLPLILSTFIFLNVSVVSVLVLHYFFTQFYLIIIFLRFFFICCAISKGQQGL